MNLLPRSIALVVVAGICTVCFSAHLPPENSMHSFRWLLGSWESQRKAGVMVESWSVLNDSSLAGTSMLYKPGGDKQLLEDIELVYRDGKYFYIASASGQNGGDRVSFLIRQFSDSGFLAENPQHDFPRRIRYRLMAKDSILATIDGGEANPEQKVDFRFHRKQ